MTAASLERCTACLWILLAGLQLQTRPVGVRAWACHCFLAEIIGSENDHGQLGVRLHHATWCRRLPGLARSIFYGRRVFAVAVEGAKV